MIGYRRWIEKEKMRLVFLWGQEDIAEIAQELSRSVSSVTHMAQLLLLSGRRGNKAFSAFWKDSGYSPSRIKFAAEHLGIRFERARRMDSRQKERAKTILVTYDQQQAILEYLASMPDGVRFQRSKQGVWGVGRKPKACIDCGTTERPHVARGRCGRCSKEYYRDLNHTNVQKQKGRKFTTEVDRAA